MHSRADDHPTWRRRGSHREAFSRDQPISFVWADPPRYEAVNLFLILDPAALWFWQKPVCQVFVSGGISHGVASFLHTLTVLSYPCYSLLILMALNAIKAAGDREATLDSEPDAPEKGRTQLFSVEVEARESPGSSPTLCGTR